MTNNSGCGMGCLLWVGGFLFFFCPLLLFVDFFDLSILLILIYLIWIVASKTTVALFEYKNWDCKLNLPLVYDVFFTCITTTAIIGYGVFPEFEWLEWLVGPSALLPVVCIAGALCREKKRQAKINSYRRNIQALQDEIKNLEINQISVERMYHLLLLLDTCDADVMWSHGHPIFQRNTELIQKIDEYHQKIAELEKNIVAQKQPSAQ